MTDEGKGKGWEYTTNDVVGMGVDWNREIFFATLNGKFLVAEHFSQIHVLYPTISIMEEGDIVAPNLGDSPFVFDIVKFKKFPHEFHTFECVDNDKRKTEVFRLTDEEHSPTFVNFFFQELVNAREGNEEIQEPNNEQDYLDKDQINFEEDQI